MAIYARENSQGMAFPNIAALDAAVDADVNSVAKDDQTSKQTSTPVVARPSLKIVK
jgi:stringent starvation protein B